LDDKVAIVTGAGRGIGEQASDYVHGQVLPVSGGSLGGMFQ
jgi:NADP-dependent 3-hydroxy acid dehydrogenase YdfG